ncbi:MAG: sugar transferase [Oscillospiraceae bacterium]|nr:sugar transferase [Oscillospiraceae bacterium]
MQSEVLTAASAVKVDSEKRTYSEIKETEIEITEASHGEGNPDGDKDNLIAREKVESSKKVYRLIKRAEDFVLSLGALIVLLIPMLIVALAIVIDSPGASPIFKQERVGKNGKTFKLWKFRSMIPDAESKLEELKDKNEMDGPVFKIKDDQRITRVGKFIRKTSIDELPQLINILRGDMSIVGPRPPLPKEVEQYDDYARQRLLVRPGLTCYWQIQPSRNKVSFDEWMKLDAKYVRDYSFKEDWKLIFRTFSVVVHKDGE